MFRTTRRVIRSWCLTAVVAVSFQSSLHMFMPTSYRSNWRTVLRYPCFTFWTPATKLGQGYVFTGVRHSVNRRGVPDTPRTWSRHHPPRDQVHPPWTRYTPTPQDQVHTLGTRYTPMPPPRPGKPPKTRYNPLPPTQSMLGDTVNERAIRILLECNLVVNHFLVPLYIPKGGKWIWYDTFLFFILYTYSHYCFDQLLRC